MIKDYLLEPKKYWPKTHHRNAVKLERFLSAACGSKKKSDIENYVECILCLGEIRSRFEKKHLYLVNAGSSGSHWIEAMLGLLPGFHNGGEIYLPKKVLDYLSGIPSSQANIALDVIYLAHLGKIYEDSISCSLSNSAHLANHEKLSQFSGKKSVVLLLRDPVDVVLSRTFRKEEYKKCIAPGVEDKEYLKNNCLYVENFYKNLDFDSFDMIVKYEDFVDSPKENLKKIVDLIELNVSDSDLDFSVCKTSKSEEVEVVRKGGVQLTNYYIGEKKNYDWAKSYVKERIGGVAENLGYC